jgi:hypothetical protein
MKYPTVDQIVAFGVFVVAPICGALAFIFGK